MYIGAGVILRNLTGQILLVCDSRSSRWGFPKGHPERCDKNLPLNTAVRECWEETGMTCNVDYVLEQVKPRRIGKRLYFTGICNREKFDKTAIPAGEISDVRWWSLAEFVGKEDVLNSDLRCWIRKARFSKSPTLGPMPCPSSS
jgi:8-oxo-dGTP pyrophosphatase MutT (NUDIX family)